MVCYNLFCFCGAVAQLVEHCIRIAGVRGSNPLSSTICFLRTPGTFPHFNYSLNTAWVLIHLFNTYTDKFQDISIFMA